MAEKRQGHWSPVTQCFHSLVIFVLVSRWGIGAMVLQLTLHCEFSKRCQCRALDTRFELDFPWMSQDAALWQCCCIFRVPDVCLRLFLTLCLVCPSIHSAELLLLA